ncbi:MAG: THUMP domain-containing protein [Candidatus Hydrothermarchaeaceae archaeon]
MAKLLVTCRDLYGEFRTKLCIRDAFEDPEISSSGFRAVLHVEIEGNVLELAEMMIRECFYDIGRVVPVLYEGNSTLTELKELAIKTALENIGEEESICFRLHKRGAHGLDKPTPEIEYEVGGSIHDALTKKYGKKPKVDLKSADITVISEVLGPLVEVGITRKNWWEEE